MAELKRGFGYWQVLALSIGSIIGTGMFFGPALGAKYAGNTSLIAWAVLCLISVYIAACFGELVSMFPRAGGLYEYSKHAYGRFPSFLIGWVAWLQMSITTTILVVAAIDYLTPSHFPMSFKILLSIVFILALNVIAYIGLEASAVTVTAFAIITLGIVLSIIIPGAFHVDMNNFSPFLTHPLIYAALAMFFIMETFFGWEAATYLAEETKEPEKVIPKALVNAAIITAALSIGVVVVSLGIFGWTTLSGLGTPMNNIAEKLFGDTGIYFIGIGVYLVLIGSAAGGIIAAPRLLLALSRDKLFLTQFSAVHKKYNTPYKAIIFQTIASIIVIFLAFGKYEALLSILVPIALVMYVFALLSVTILRYKYPDAVRQYKVIFAKTGPVLIAIIFVAVLVIWAVTGENIRLLIQALLLILLGIPLYLLLEMYYDPKMIIRVNNALARITLWTEGFSLPKSVRKEIAKELGNLKGKKVLEFGCNVGTFTEYLAEAVSKDGTVYATNTSKNELEITRKRLLKKGHKHVQLILEQSKEGVHESVPDVNLAVSIGALGYVQNIEKLLHQINKRLDKGEKIFFMEYDKFFYLMPNTPWLNKDETIIEVFKKAGFDVKVARHNDIFWQYIFITGHKKKEVKQ